MVETRVGEVPLRERFYYKRVHGFDPQLDRTWLDDKKTKYRYEQEFQLDKDPILARAGVTIAARVDVSPGKVENRIIFKRGRRHTSVSCIHTAVCTLDAAEAFGRDLNGNRVIEWARTTETFTVNLSPEEHFASLKSYVAGISEMGIHNLMYASYESEEVNPQTLPFGFNAAMQKQVMGALRRLAPKETEAMVAEFVLELVDSVPYEWVVSRLGLLQGIYRIKKYLPEGYLGTSDVEDSDQPVMARYLFKVIVLGNDADGKALVLNTIIENQFNTSYKDVIGTDIYTATVGEGHLSMWDLSDRERFQFIRTIYYHGAAGVILFFNPWRPGSWEEIVAWYEEVVDVAGELPFVLVALSTGTGLGAETADLQEFREFARERGGLFTLIETRERNLGEIERTMGALVEEMILERL
ncbi:MAG: hypothetical protein ACTSU5_13540 [Promethearchaeota archaeon]